MIYTNVYNRGMYSKQWLALAECAHDALSLTLEIKLDKGHTE